MKKTTDINHEHINNFDFGPVIKVELQPLGIQEHDKGKLIFPNNGPPPPPATQYENISASPLEPPANPSPMVSSPLSSEADNEDSFTLSETENEPVQTSELGDDNAPQPTVAVAPEEALTFVRDLNVYIANQEPTIVKLVEEDMKKESTIVKLREEIAKLLAKEAMKT